MYAVVEYDDYRKEQTFQVIISTDNLDYAKKVAFQNAKNVCVKKNSGLDSPNYKITTKIENEYLRPLNDMKNGYKVICVENMEKGSNLKYSYSKVYAVLEIKKDDIKIEEIDTSYICDDWVEDY